MRNPAELLRLGSACYDEQDEGWLDSSFPPPLVFAPTDEAGEPQPNVEVL